jgi:hypothetical protein
VETFSYQKLIFINVQNSHIVILALVFKVLNPVVREVAYEEKSSVFPRSRLADFVTAKK